jgi:magnesium transporter
MATIRLMVNYYYSNARNRTLLALDEPRAGSWISLAHPNQAELQTFAQRYGLDLDLLNDALDIYEAPRVETSDGNVYIYVRYCHPEGAEIATEPMLIVYAADVIITISRIETTTFDRLLAGHAEIVTTQKAKALMLLLGQINLSYRLQMNRVSKQILRFRAELKKSNISNKEFIRIIELEEDLNEFLAALQPQAATLALLTSGKHLRLYDDDRDIIEDLRLDVAELIEFTKSRLGALRNVRQVHDAIATNNLNNTFKRLTSIAIFLTIPTIIGGLFGMNVKLPMEQYTNAFYVILGLIATFIAIAIGIFRRKEWL